MRRYPGNHTDSELLTVPRFLKTRPGAPQTHLAYITDSEADLLKENKPGTPHGGPHGIPNYDSYEYQTAREEQQAYARETGQSTQQAASSLGTSYSAPSTEGGKQEERQFDRQTQIQQNIKNEQEKKARAKQDIINKQKQDKVKASIKLGEVLRSSGTSKSEWQRMMDKGSLSPEVALQMGLAKQLPDGRIIDPATGEGWVPKGKLTKDMITGMEDLQFMQDEGVYGGVAGIESEVNKQKEEVKNTLRDISRQIDNKTGGTLSNEELQKRAWEQLQKTAGEKGSALGSLSTLFGEKGAPDMNTALMNIYGMTEEERKATGTAAGYDVGYDPTGVYTFSEIEDSAKYGKNDPRNLYQNKFLQRGTLWDDPLSGTLAPQKNINYGGGWGSGWGGYGGGGGSGDGGGFGYSTHDPLQRGYQRAQVGPGSLQEQVNQIYLGMSNLNPAPGFQKKRGGIVSLVQ